MVRVGLQVSQLIVSQCVRVFGRHVNEEQRHQHQPIMEEEVVVVGGRRKKKKI